ncbi:phage-like protein [Yersinia kristensenii]|nr:phage-like protein [Yersinia kristensenii]
MTNLEELREHCEEIMAISPLRYAYIPASSIITLIDRIEKAEAELSAANEKLSKPVEFPDCDISAVSHMAHWYSEKQCEAWVAGVEFSKKQIIKAGFTVAGEPALVKYIVILQRAWCNDSSSGINYHSDLVEFDKRDKAIKYGFELQDSDDFNIGVLTNGVLTSFDWMAKPIAETKDSLARIANGIGIEGNADAE